jgi:hypothetical protein
MITGQGTKERAVQALRAVFDGTPFGSGRREQACSRVGTIVYGHVCYTRPWLAELQEFSGLGAGKRQSFKNERVRTGCRAQGARWHQCC